MQPRNELGRFTSIYNVGKANEIIDGKNYTKRLWEAHTEEWRNEYRKKNRDFINSNLRAYATRLMHNYKYTDRHRNLPNPVDFDVDWLLDNIINQPDFYDGLMHDPFQMGADRIDNTQGHCKANIVPCWRMHNYRRQDKYTVDQFKYKITMEKLAEIEKKISDIKELMPNPFPEEQREAELRKIREKAGIPDPDATNEDLALEIFGEPIDEDTQFKTDTLDDILEDIFNYHYPSDRRSEWTIVTK